MRVLLTLVVLAATARGKTVINHRQSNTENTQKQNEYHVTTIKSSLEEHNFSNSKNKPFQHVDGFPPDSSPLDSPLLSNDRSIDDALNLKNDNRLRYGLDPNSYHPDDVTSGSDKRDGEKRLSKIIATLFNGNEGTRDGSSNSSQVFTHKGGFKNSDYYFTKRESTDDQLKNQKRQNPFQTPDDLKQPKFFVLRRTNQYLAQMPQKFQSSSPLTVLAVHNTNRTESHPQSPDSASKNSGPFSGLLSPKFFLRPRDSKRPVEKRSRRKPVFEIVNGPHKRKRYDVPQVECPPTHDGTERFACPSPDTMGRYRCMQDHAMCDGFIDCPNAEDEDRTSCMFYHTTKAHLDVLAEALLRWARGRY